MYTIESTDTNMYVLSSCMLLTVLIILDISSESRQILYAMSSCMMLCISETMLESRDIYGPSYAYKPYLVGSVCCTVARWLKTLQNNMTGGYKKYCFLPKSEVVCPPNEPESGLERALHFYLII